MHVVEIFQESTVYSLDRVCLLETKPWSFLGNGIIQQLSLNAMETKVWKHNVQEMGLIKLELSHIGP